MINRLHILKKDNMSSIWYINMEHGTWFFFFNHHGYQQFFFELVFKSNVIPLFICNKW